MRGDTGGPDVGRLARRLLALDLSVIPVPRPQPGVPPGQPGDGKVPAIAWSAYQQRRPTAREIDAWFGAAPMNLAVVTGKVSGVVVIDADSLGLAVAGAWLWTPWQTQTARGFSWYRHPGIRVPNRARRHGRRQVKIDVRGDGGYVIAPGSLHASGAASAGGRLEQTRLESRCSGLDGWRAPGPPRRTTPDHREALARARTYWRRFRSQVRCGSDADTLYATCRLVRGFASSVDAKGCC
jgi:hypothetical protein